MPARIVVAEDDRELSASICEAAQMAGYRCDAFADPRQALETTLASDIDVLVTDLKMPHIDGVDLARQVISRRPNTRVVVITAYSTLSTVQEALRMGIDSYMLKPFGIEELLFNIERSLERRRLILENQRYQAGLEVLVEDQILELQSRQEKLSRSQMENIFAIGNIIEARDPYTRGHTERVTFFAVALAAKLGWSEDRIRELGIGSPLHDIGKIGVPDNILKKRGPLTDREFDFMKQHSEIGYSMIKGTNFSAATVACIVYHHERVDGRGYPFGLRGRDIPAEGRVMAICDVFDAVSSDRIYRPALPYDECVRIVREGSGTQFDSEYVEAFLELLGAGQLDEEVSQANIRERFGKLVSRLISF